MTFAQQAVAARLERPLPDELRHRVRAGQSLRQIGGDLGISHEAVRAWLEEFGISRHDDDGTPGRKTRVEKHNGPDPQPLAGDVERAGATGG